jgi:hypothetical protein
MNNSKMEVKIAEAAAPSLPTAVSPNATITPQEAIRLLRHPERQRSAARDPAFAHKVASSKAASVISGDQETAKLFWHAQGIAQAQLSFEKSFGLMKEYKYYEAWCELERCELTVASLQQHFAVAPEDSHRIGYIQTMVERWQAIYPYKIFFSPEILKKRVECSTCGARVSLRNPCGHEKGEIYDGEECHHRVVECELLSISAVTNPVQKYSVGFLSSEDGSGSRDHYNYAIVKFAIDRLASPYHGWLQEDQARTIPIASVAHLPADSNCPCGSGSVFGGCCATKPEVIVSHCQFVFFVQPPPELPQNQLNV